MLNRKGVNRISFLNRGYAFKGLLAVIIITLILHTYKSHITITPTYTSHTLLSHAFNTHTSITLLSKSIHTTITLHHKYHININSYNNRHHFNICIAHIHCHKTPVAKYAPIHASIANSQSYKICKAHIQT